MLNTTGSPSGSSTSDPDQAFLTSGPAKRGGPVRSKTCSPSRIWNTSAAFLLTLLFLMWMSLQPRGGRLSGSLEAVRTSTSRSAEYKQLTKRE